MGRRAWSFAAVALAGLAACSGGRRRADRAEPAVRIWAPALVRWDPGDERTVRFALENGTARTVTLAAPDPRRARVVVYAQHEDRKACGAEPSDPPAGDPVSLAPGDQVTVRVDLTDACRSLAPGEYRLEIEYQPPKAVPGEAGAPSPRTGVVVVAAPRR